MGMIQDLCQEKSRKKFLFCAYFLRSGCVLPLIVTLMNLDCVLSVVSAIIYGTYLALFNYAHDGIPDKKVAPHRLSSSIRLSVSSV